MENYIVRIYRRDPSDPDAIIGTVECVETQTQQPFHGIRKLGNLLSRTPQQALTQPGKAFLNCPPYTALYKTTTRKTTKED